MTGPGCRACAVREVAVGCGPARASLPPRTQPQRPRFPEGLCRAQGCQYPGAPPPPLPWPGPHQPVWGCVRCCGRVASPRGGGASWERPGQAVVSCASEGHRTLQVLCQRLPWPRLRCDVQKGCELDGPVASRSSSSFPLSRRCTGRCLCGQRGPSAPPHARLPPGLLREHEGPPLRQQEGAGLPLQVPV